MSKQAEIMRGIYLMGDIMDKEIIIDGVKVEECSYYNKDNTPYYCEVWDNECEAQNCYYKQLKRLEQENEELKAENERLKEEIKEVKKYQYEQEFLEKEIEEQREKNKRLTCKILEVKALNETLNVQCTSQDCTQLRKLHQTLQEIKKIAEEDCKFCDDIGGCMDNECRKVRILDLINKTEEE